MTTATRRRGLAGAAALTILVLAGGCSSGSDDSMSDSPAAGGDVAAEPAGPADGVDADARASAKRDAASVDQSLADEESAQFNAYSLNGAADQAVAPAAGSLEEAPAEAPPATETDDGTPAKLISNGAVQLKSDDVGQAIFDVRNVVDKYAGEVEANATETDDEGEPLRSRLKVRVPTAQFDQAMQDLEGVATLIASSGNTEDVTTEVLDRNIRIQVQRRSIDRISLLLDRAVSIRDVVSIEAQLSQRQADLAVLEKQQRYLDDQTAMATINVSVERTKDKKPTPKPTKKKDDDSGFFSGLSSGWDGLKTFGEGVATVVGALLPWTIVAAILAIPGLPLYRRLRRREVVAAPTPSPAP